MPGLGRCPDLRNPDLGGSTDIYNTFSKICGRTFETPCRSENMIF